MNEPNILCIIDMQNDFISGALGTLQADAATENAVKEITRKKWDRIIFTRDTHESNYLSTQEGKMLPVPHCIFKSDGWVIDNRIQRAIDQATKNGTLVTKAINKISFGTFEWKDRIDRKECEGIEIIGLCTDICVITNALILKTMYPETPIYVKEDCCAGVTNETHKAAIDVMKSCQVIVI